MVDSAVPEHPESLRPNEVVSINKQALKANARLHDEIAVLRPDASLGKKRRQQQAKFAEIHAKGRSQSANLRKAQVQAQATELRRKNPQLSDAAVADRLAKPGLSSRTIRRYLRDR